MIGWVVSALLHLMLAVFVVCGFGLAATVLHACLVDPLGQRRRPPAESEPAFMTAQQVALLEHEVLSPGFIAQLRATELLDHPASCTVCSPTMRETGLHPDPERRCYTRGFDCPLCGHAIREAAECLATWAYERHLDTEHYRLPARSS